MILLLSLQRWPEPPARATHEEDSAARSRVKHDPIQEIQGRTVWGLGARPPHCNKIRGGQDNDIRPRNFEDNEYEDRRIKKTLKNYSRKFRQNICKNYNLKQRRIPIYSKHLCLQVQKNCPSCAEENLLNKNTIQQTEIKPASTFQEVFSSQISIRKQRTSSLKFVFEHQMPTLRSRTHSPRHQGQLSGNNLQVVKFFTHPISIGPLCADLSERSAYIKRFVLWMNEYRNQHRVLCSSIDPYKHLNPFIHPFIQGF